MTSTDQNRCALGHRVPRFHSYRETQIHRQANIHGNLPNGCTLGHLCPRLFPADLFMAFIDRGEEEYITSVTNRFCSVRVGLEYIFEHTGLMYMIRQRDRDVETEAQGYRRAQTLTSTVRNRCTLGHRVPRFDSHRETQTDRKANF